jgi:hypothetical protein
MLWKTCELTGGRRGLPPLSLALIALALGFGVPAAPATAADCPNEALRTGPSSELPDCRAYELVSPPDSNGRLLTPLIALHYSDVFSTSLITPAGNSVLFMTDNSSLDQPEEPNGSLDLYAAERSSAGWQTVRHLSPSGAQGVLPDPGGVSGDHRYTFANVAPVEGGALPGGSLAEEGDADYLVSPDGSFELTGVGSLGSERLAQGRYISPGGDHVIFTTGGAWCKAESKSCLIRQLEPTAPATGTAAIYDRRPDGPTRTVSRLPGDITPAAGEAAEYQGSSADGTVVAFKIKDTLYVRVDGAETKLATASESSYAGLSADGGFLFYVSAGNIFRFDTSTGQTQQINSSGDATVDNVSADGSHVYFLSATQLDGSKGTAGQPNMYVWSGGGLDFIATVLPSDVLETSPGDPALHYPALGNWTRLVVTPDPPGPGAGPGADPSRATADGGVYVFESRAQLTSYENAGHTEIYRFDDGDKNLRCLSCNPSGTPATGDARLENATLVSLPVAIHNLSSDGARVVFESTEDLVSRDSDGTNDIYEWREDGGLALISSGKSVDYPPLMDVPGIPLPQPNTLFAVTPSGNSVVFSASEQLVPSAGSGGTQGLYDARVNGGFPELPPSPECVEEGCRPRATVPPILSGPASDRTTGSGNVIPRRKKHRRCRDASKPKKQKRCGGRRVSRAAQGAAGASAVDAGAGGIGAADTDPFESPGFDIGTGPRAAAGLLSSSEFSEFGIKSLGAQLSSSAAGDHADFVTKISLNRHLNKQGRSVSSARLRGVAVSLPPGLVGDPTAIPRCDTGRFVAFGNCPIDSQVGVSNVLLNGRSGEATEPLYNLAPPHPEREIARLGFFAGIAPVFIDVTVRTGSDYGVTATVHGAPGQDPVLAATTILWGNPPDPSHDELRLTTAEATECNTACKAPGGKRSSGLAPVAFMTNPSACQAGEVAASVASYQLPGQTFGARAPLSPITDCRDLPFAPTFEAHPTNRRAGAPTGLSTVLKLPQSADVESPATATMREARVTLPEGMTIAAGAADGLEACSDQQVHLHQEVAAECPDAAKLGTVTVLSPNLPNPLRGALYQRTPEPGHLFRLWLVTDELGLHVKLPGEIKADARTGQLTAVFADLPQLPAEEIDIDVWGGARAPLKNPDACGTYVTTSTFVPHSEDPAVSGQSQMTIDQGCGQPGFSPRLEGGVTEPVAGAFSPLILDLSRADGEQNIGRFEITLPEGELARLAGVPLCPEAVAAAGACPAGSKIGTVTVATGPGAQPLWIPQPGKAPTAIYLSGPYKGAPFSAVTVVPAQAGPFDLGTVAVRAGLYVNPETGQASVKSDPLPQFLEGVPVIYRKVHAVIDRPDFSLNPTNCAELALTSTISSVSGSVAHPSDRFQLDGCRALKFRPKLTLKLSGGTRRGDYPALQATLKMRAGGANVRKVSVALPHSEFLAQEHIRTICTRVQFAAHKCPKGSIYGKAMAVTPLLDKPLRGPVYLRSSSHALPDLVAAMHGAIDIDLVGRIDSVKGGIRTTFSSVPDAPVRKFALNMKGGQKGLLTNSQDICGGRHLSLVKFWAQNGRVSTPHPALRASCSR